MHRLSPATRGPREVECYVSIPLTAYRKTSATLPVLPAFGRGETIRPCLSEAEAEAQTGPGPKQPKEPQRTLWAYLCRLVYAPATGPIRSNTASQECSYLCPSCSCAPSHQRRVVISYPSQHTPAVLIVKPIKASYTQLQKHAQSFPPRIHTHRIMSDSNDTAEVDLPPAPVSSGRRATTPSRPSGVPRISSRAVEGGTLACRRCHHRKKKVSGLGRSAV
jgi:rubredoxin